MGREGGGENDGERGERENEGGRRKRREGRKKEGREGGKNEERRGREGGKNEERRGREGGKEGQGMQLMFSRTAINSTIASCTSQEAVNTSTAPTAQISVPPSLPPSLPLHVAYLDPGVLQTST